MMSKHPVAEFNHLLAALPSNEYRRLLPHLQLVPIEEQQILLDRGRIRDVYFPVSGVVAKRVQMEDGDCIEAGMVGNEGMVPVCLFMGLDPTPFSAVVQNAGMALRMKAGVFKREMDAGHLLHRILLRFTAAFMAQISQSVGCHQHHPLEARYGRWLLMTHDRMRADRFALTQKTVAQFLGVRRMSIIPVAQKFHQQGLICHSRGHITITDRAGLESISCECYRRVEDVYDALLKNRHASSKAAPQLRRSEIVRQSNAGSFG